jgi:formylglycine-generating enzyme required for sulfatase activity
LRKVQLNDFYLGQAPVTNDLFDMFVRETGYMTDAEEAGYGIVFEGRCTNTIDPETGREIFSLTRGTLARHVSGASWRHPAGPGSSLEGKHNHPVVQVSHHDAMAFAAWAGKRLPTEEEWEAAARGKNGQLFPWGDRWVVNLGNFEAACLGGTTSVEHYGRKAMSPFGIFDLLGNVAEWTSTPHAEQADLQPGRSGERIYILKGGSWITGGIVTAAWRQIERGKYWTNTIGFRCAV